jgi:hypothetical protein
MNKNEIVAAAQASQFKQRDTIVGYEGLLKSIAVNDKNKENDSKYINNFSFKNHRRISETERNFIS